MYLSTVGDAIVEPRFSFSCATIHGRNGGEEGEEERIEWTLSETQKHSWPRAARDVKGERKLLARTSARCEGITRAGYIAPPAARGSELVAYTLST